MKRVTYTFAILALLYSIPVSAQNDTTDVVVEEEVLIIQDTEAAEEPQAVPDVEAIKVEIDQEVQEAIDEAMEAMNEALREADEALEELENDPNLSEADRQRVREGRERLLEVDGQKVKIVIQKNDGDSLKEDQHRTIKISMESDQENLPHNKRRHSLVSTDWFNLQFGWANVLNQDKKLEMPDGYKNMNFKGNSHSFHMSVVEQAWNLIGDQVRLTYGLGFTWNAYNLEEDARLFKDQDGVLIPVVDDNISYDRNRLNVTYATLPVGLQFQLGQGGKRRIKIGGGLNMGYLLGANQKLKWEDNGEFTGKITNNYNLEPFRLGYQAQVGYGSFHLYGRYFPNSMFKKDLGPDVNQFSVGVLIGSI